MAAPVVIRVHEQAVRSYRDLEVADAVNEVVILGMASAKALAPVRTGGLKANIRYARAAPRGPYQTMGYFYANIRYARYVNEGTTGPIYPRTARKLAFRSNNAKQTWVRRDFVAGQKGQRFMEKGLMIALGKKFIGT